MAGSKPGERRGGRQRGTPNKLTADVRTAILAAFARAGGVDYLRRQAEANPTAFLTLLGKVLPLQVTHNGEVGLKVEVVRYTDGQITALLEAAPVSVATLDSNGNGHSVC